jgi:hypothetical protein
VEADPAQPEPNGMRKLLTTVLSWELRHPLRSLLQRVNGPKHRNNSVKRSNYLRVSSSQQILDRPQLVVASAMTTYLNLVSSVSKGN